ncbi:hypothetical protein [Eubacterium sp. AB3007]|uniref:hypothetical protein n=1 Tax=Eubacterium sp. AB3007 TaxID=1392487 RepID=UPI000A4CE385|nr:hypothetical protein [Eubacterium sp. AB3007]
MQKAPPARCSLHPFGLVPPQQITGDFRHQDREAGSRKLVGLFFPEGKPALFVENIETNGY